MAFVPRSYADITQALIAFLQANPDVADGVLPSDFVVGSMERAHLEAVALAMEETDQLVAVGLETAIRESCYHAFGFDRLAPTRAVGSVTVGSFALAGATVNVPAGTRFVGPSGVLFESVAPGSIPSGSSVSAPIPIRAVDAGSTGNVGSGTIQRMVGSIVGIETVNNPSATVGGQDEESDESRARRFDTFIRTLVRATKESLEFAAISAVPGAIADARAVEPFLLDPVPAGVPYAGLVWLFADDGTSAADLDTGVRAAIEQVVNGYLDAQGRPVPGYKAAGVVVQLVKSPSVDVAVRADVRVSSAGVSRWAAIQTALTEAATSYFQGLRIGESVSYQNLVAALSLADPDLREVDLIFWKVGDAVPGYGTVPSAADLGVYDSTQPLSVGARAHVYAGAIAGVSYPEWRLVE